MNARKRLHNMQARLKAECKYPLPEGKPDLRNCFGTMKRYNPMTGKYDLPA